MAYRVLVVDDSAFYRRRVSQILEQDPELEVVGDARNGLDAVKKVAALQPDVVTMDIEMPIMDGITAVKEIMQAHPLPILMFSSLTHEGATATLDSLDAGALDFLPKNFEDIAVNRKEAVQLLQFRVKALARRKTSVRKFIRPLTENRSEQTTVNKGPRMFLQASNSAVEPSRQTTSHFTSRSGKHYKALAIGTSTGGPVALQRILTKLPASFPSPILLVQHMPGTFTTAFAERLNDACKIKVKEAQQGDILESGVAYLAPGGRQMTLAQKGASVQVSIGDLTDTADIYYKPSVDLTFQSIAEVIGGDVLAVILTGMGSDGREGCKRLKQKGAKVWAQDEASSVVYGMPQAVVTENIADKVLALDDFASSITSEIRA